MEDYPALMPPAAVPALMPQTSQGALLPQLKFQIGQLMAKGILPFYNNISQKARDGQLSDQDALWDQYVQSILKPQQPQSRFSPYINGTPVPNPNPVQMYPGIAGVRG